MNENTVFNQVTMGQYLLKQILIYLA